MAGQRVSRGTTALGAAILMLVGAIMVPVGTAEEYTDTSGTLVSFSGVGGIIWNYGSSFSQSIGNLEGYKNCLGSSCTWGWEHEGTASNGWKYEAKCVWNGSSQTGFLKVMNAFGITQESVQCNHSSYVTFSGEVRPDEVCHPHVQGWGVDGSFDISVHGEGEAICQVFSSLEA